MNVRICGNTLNGTITAPPSKSFMQRVCVMALLHNGNTIIHNPGFSADEQSVLNVIQSLGAQVKMDNPQKLVRIVSDGNQNFKGNIFVGESGLAARMLSPIVALSKQKVEISGSNTLLKRPFHALRAMLPQFGVQFYDTDGLLPIQIQGPLIPCDAHIDGHQSSQYLTGLLIALSFSTPKNIRLTVDQLVSTPYIDITIQLLQKFGCRVEHEDYKVFHILPRIIPGHDIEITIEGDWSSAAPFIVGGVVAGQVKIEGLDKNSLQADKALMEVLKRCEANFRWNQNTLEVFESKNLSAFEFDSTDAPDLFPPLSVLALFANGNSPITGVKRLLNKESNRAVSISEMIHQLGGQIELRENKMFIKGPAHLKECVVDSAHDHRIVMAAAIAAIGGNVCVEITHADSVEKSYPRFFEDLKLLGAKVSVI
jgi:3-phosphoshikimate 1-carboxyvinyltransferase